MNSFIISTRTLIVVNISILEDLSSKYLACHSTLFSTASHTEMVFSASFKLFIRRAFSLFIRSVIIFSSLYYPKILLYACTASVTFQAEASYFSFNQVKDAIAWKYLNVRNFEHAIYNKQNKQMLTSNVIWAPRSRILISPSFLKSIQSSSNTSCGNTGSNSFASKWIEDLGGDRTDIASTSPVIWASFLLFCDYFNSHELV